DLLASLSQLRIGAARLHGLRGVESRQIQHVLLAQSLGLRCHQGILAHAFLEGLQLLDDVGRSQTGQARPLRVTAVAVGTVAGSANRSLLLAGRSVTLSGRGPGRSQRSACNERDQPFIHLRTPDAGSQLFDYLPADAARWSFASLVQEGAQARKLYQR